MVGWESAGSEVSIRSYPVQKPFIVTPVTVNTRAVRG